MQLKLAERLGVRHGQIFLLFWALFAAQALRSSMYMGIVAMTDANLSHSFTEEWTTGQKGIVLGLFPYGNMIFAIPCGIIAKKFSTRYVFGISGLLSGLMNAIFPIVTLYAGFIGSCVVRTLIGAVQGFLFPCIFQHTANWSGPGERSFFLACLYTGIPLGSIVMENSAGFLANYFGWPSIFYASGLCYILWSAWWYICARDSPVVHDTISEAEKSSIVSRLSFVSEERNEFPVPWLKICSNGPFLALIVVQALTLWGSTVLDSMLPTFLRGVYRYDIATNGFLSSLPSVGTLATSALIPFLAKFISSRFNLSLTFQKKLWSSIAVYGAGIGFLLISQLNLGSIETLSIFVIARSLTTLNHLGIMGNEVDLSPNFAPILTGITNVISSLSAMAAPIASGYILHDESDPSDWSGVFLLAALINFIGITVYVIFGSAEMQYWNSRSSEKTPIKSTLGSYL